MKKDIYITSLHMQHGGVEMAITLLSNALVKKGYNVTILSIYNLGQPVYQLHEKVKVIYLTNVHPNKAEVMQCVKNKKFFSAIKEALYSIKVLILKRQVIKRAIEGIKTGCIISTRNEHSTLLSKYGRDGVLKIAQLHNDHEFSEKYIRDFRKHYNNIDKFAVLTEKTQKEIIEFVRGYNSRMECVVIPNFLENSVNVYQEEERENVVVAVGRIHPVKGFLRLIDIWNEVSKITSDWKLKIIGSGDIREMDKLQKKIADYGLEEHVILTGALPHSEVMNVMKKSSVFAMTSYTESFSFVIIEAMQSGLPILAYDVRVGPAALIRSGEEGYLIPDGDLKEFTDKLLYLFQNHKEWERMSKNARSRAKDFEEDKVLEKWIDILGVRDEHGL